MQFRVEVIYLSKYKRHFDHVYAYNFASVCVCVSFSVRSIYQSLECQKKRVKKSEEVRNRVSQVE